MSDKEYLSEDNDTLFNSYPPSPSPPDDDVLEPILPSRDARATRKRHSYSPDGDRSRQCRVTRGVVIIVVVALFLCGIVLILILRASRTVSDSSVAPVSEWTIRAESVKAAYRHAYNGYMKNAFPEDELKPVSGNKANNLNGWALTTIDSLDTMLLMGLHEEFDQGVRHVETLDFVHYGYQVPFFETTIRYTGGLLSAYQLSLNLPSTPTLSSETRSRILLSKVDELAAATLGVFNTTSGFPWHSVQPTTNQTMPSWEGGKTGLAEPGSCQLEYKLLAHLTGKHTYFKKVDRIVDLYQQHQEESTGLWNVYWSVHTGAPVPSDYVSIGAFADSAYEYLLKGYLLSGKSETRLLDMHLKAMEGIIDNLLYISSDRNLLYVTDLGDGKPSHKQEELSCFLPGLFALSAHLVPESDNFTARDRQLHLWVAEGLATTCYLAFADSVGGLAPESINFDHKNRKWRDALNEWERGGRWRQGASRRPPGVPDQVQVEKDPAKRDYSHADSSYNLRPETVESLFLLYRVTKDEKWRQRGWEIFQAIEKNTKTEHGYSSVQLVDTDEPSKVDDMPSFFLAETLKYLWLLLSEGDGGIPLDKFVFNTEAHPLRVFEWSAEEKSIYGL